MRFYLVDRILEVVPRERIRALKRVSGSDLLIEDRPTDGPVLAPSLVIECLAQTSAWLILATTGFASRGVLAGLRDIQVGDPARLGSRLDLVSTVDSWSDEAVMFNVEASCGRESVLRIVGALCFLISADQLEDPNQTEAQYRALCAGDSAPLDDTAPERRVARLAEGPRWAPFDAMLEFDRGVEAAAVKWVSMTDPVFSTHFPRLPVVPGVLLLQGIVQVARELLRESCPGTRWALDSIQGARFRKYVRPGDELVLRARVRDLGDDRAALTGSAEVSGANVVSLRHLVFSREADSASS